MLYNLRFTSSKQASMLFLKLRIYRICIFVCSSHGLLSSSCSCSRSRHRNWMWCLSKDPTRWIHCLQTWRSKEWEFYQRRVITCRAMEVGTGGPHGEGIDLATNVLTRMGISWCRFWSNLNWCLLEFLSVQMRNFFLFLWEFVCFFLLHVLV